MNSRLGSLTIERFRAFRELTIEGLGRVNLITGQNNTGKSSVLEALRILASDASPYVLYSILAYREENLGGVEELVKPLDNEGLFQLSSIFHGFPQISNNIPPVVISSNGGLNPMRVSLEVGWFSEERGQDGSKRLVARQESLFPGDERLPSLVVEAGGTSRFFALDSLWRYAQRSRPVRFDVVDEPRVPCAFVSPYGGERTATLASLWDKIALSDSEKDVVEALRIIDNSILAVSMVGGEGARQYRTAIV